MDIFAQINETAVEGEGQIESGFLVASIKNIGLGNAIVNGVILSSGQAKGYPFVGKAYNAIPYNTQESTLQIMRID